MDHPLVILGVFLVVILGAFLVGVWLLGRLRTKLHIKRLRNDGRVIGWDDAIERLRHDSDSIVVFEALALRTWWLTGEDAKRFTEGYDNKVECCELARFVESRGVLVGQLPCASTGPAVGDQLKRDGLAKRHVFLDTDVAWGMAGMFKRFAPREKRRNR